TEHMRDVGYDIFGGEKSMKCAFHPEVAAAGFCRSCGKAMCPACACPNPRDRRVLYCEKCLFLLIARVEEGRARIESPMNSEFEKHEKQRNLLGSIFICGVLLFVAVALVAAYY